MLRQVKEFEVRTEPKTEFAHSDSQDTVCTRTTMLSNGMVDTNPWRASFCSLPVEQQPTTGLLCVLSKSKDLGLRQNSVGDTREMQQYTTAVLQHVNAAKRKESQEVSILTYRLSEHYCAVSTIVCEADDVKASRRRATSRMHCWRSPLEHQGGVSFAWVGLITYACLVDQTSMLKQAGLLWA